jgi:PBP1b-binding outer membrane lipoprotein LpoB
MKKLLAIGLILMLLAIVAGCATNDGQSTDKQTGNSDAETVTGDPVLDNIEDTPEEVIDGVELDDIMDDISMDDW